MFFGKNIIRRLITLMLLMSVAIICCYVAVSVNANGKAYDRIENIPINHTGLLLGTSPVTPQGEHNYYFDNRIKAMSDLYKKGSIKQIIASGGDYSYRENGYNELIAMRDSLGAHGVPDSIILLDYQGTRTFNSIVNAKDIYGIDSLIIISQKYHNERAIWLAEYYGIHAIAYNAPMPDIINKNIKNISREFLARVKMFLDLVINEIR